MRTTAFADPKQLDAVDLTLKVTMSRGAWLVKP